MMNAKEASEIAKNFKSIELDAVKARIEDTVKEAAESGSFQCSARCKESLKQDVKEWLKYLNFTVATHQLDELIISW